MFPPPYCSIPPWTQSLRPHQERRGEAGIWINSLFSHPFSSSLFFHQIVQHNNLLIGMIIGPWVERRAWMEKLTWCHSNSSKSCRHTHLFVCLCVFFSIHPYSLFRLSLSRMLEPIAATIGREVEYTLRETDSHSHPWAI